MTFITVATVATVGAAYDDILKYFTLLGGFLCVFVCFYAPFALFLKVSTKPWMYWKNVVVFVVMHLLVIFGWGSAILSFFLPKRVIEDKK